MMSEVYTDFIELIREDCSILSINKLALLK